MIPKVTYHKREWSYKFEREIDHVLDVPVSKYQKALIFLDLISYLRNHLKDLYNYWIIFLIRLRPGIIYCMIFIELTCQMYNDIKQMFF